MPKVLNKKVAAGADAVYVGRPSRWGNRFVIGKDGNRAAVVRLHREWLLGEDGAAIRERARTELRGKDLLCWCAPEACHADVLLEVANSDDAEVIEMESSAVTTKALRRWLIAGSRGYGAAFEERVFAALDKVAAVKGLPDVVVEGGANGADRLGRRWAEARGVEVRTMKADWDGLGKKAGMLRNSAMIAEASRVIVFWDGASKGTADTISKARAAKLPLTIFVEGKGKDAS